MSVSDPPTPVYMHTYVANYHALGILSLLDDELLPQVAAHGSSASMGRWQRRVGSEI